MDFVFSSVAAIHGKIHVDPQVKSRIEKLMKGGKNILDAEVNDRRGVTEDAVFVLSFANGLRQAATAAIKELGPGHGAEMTAENFRWRMLDILSQAFDEYKMSVSDTPTPMEHHGQGRRRRGDAIMEQEESIRKAGLLRETPGSALNGARNTPGYKKLYSTLVKHSNDKLKTERENLTNSIAWIALDFIALLGLQLPKTSKHINKGFLLGSGDEGGSTLEAQGRDLFFVVFHRILFRVRSVLKEGGERLPVFKNLPPLLYNPTLDEKLKWSDKKSEQIAMKDFLNAVSVLPSSPTTPTGSDTSASWEARSIVATSCFSEIKKNYHPTNKLKNKINPPPWDLAWSPRRLNIIKVNGLLTRWGDIMDHPMVVA